MEKLERKLERARSGESSGRASDALATFELTRPVVGASALGIAQAAYEWTLAYLDNGGSVDPIEEYLDESSTAGRPPLERQASSSVLADVATEIEAAPPARAASLMDGPQRHPDDGRPGLDVEAEGRGRRDVGDPHLHGPRRPIRQSTDCPLEKWFRDAKIYQLFEGTAEIQRLVISRMQAAEYRERLAGGHRGRGGRDRRRPVRKRRSAKAMPDAGSAIGAGQAAGGRRLPDRPGPGEAARRVAAAGSKPERWLSAPSGAGTEPGAPREDKRPRRPAGGNRRRMWIAAAINAALIVAAVVGGILTGSLALLADAGHALSDVGAIALGLLAAGWRGEPAVRAGPSGSSAAR